MFQEFPYTNFHELNLDWIVKIAKDFLDQYTHIQEVIQTGLDDLAESRETGLAELDQKRLDSLAELNQKTLDGLADLQTKYDTLDGLLQAWYDTHSADIAGQLADAIADFNAAAEAKSQALLDSWPSDYSELVTEFDALKSAFTYNGNDAYCNFSVSGNAYKSYTFISGESYIIESFGPSSARFIIDIRETTSSETAAQVLVNNAVCGRRYIVTATTNGGCLHVYSSAADCLVTVTKLSEYYKKTTEFIITQRDIIKGDYGVSSETKRIHLNYVLAVQKGDVIRFNNPNLYFIARVYSSSDASTSIEESGWLDGKANYTINNNGYLGIAIANANTYASSTNINVTDFTGFVVLYRNYPGVLKAVTDEFNRIDNETETIEKTIQYLNDSEIFDIDETVTANTSYYIDDLFIPKGTVIVFENLIGSSSCTINVSDGTQEQSITNNVAAGKTYTFTAPFDVVRIRSYVAGESLKVKGYALYKEIYDIDVYVNSLKSLENYVIGADFIKRPVKVEQLTGTLTYAQAFCKYNNKYYSISGNNIAVQNSSFELIDTKALALGHGNSFQLASNGAIAYASGWNDQKLYVVDLEDLEIDSIITLPTTGYTTGVVDSANNIAYIFQRNSNPETEDNYKFIVYDITNESIISQKYIKSFGAMQAADFYEGKIAVVYGMGSAGTVANGIFVCNTVGDILADYHIEAIETVEGEGVFFDRNTKELLISDDNKNVYRITGV